MAPFLHKVGISFSLCTPTPSLEIYFVSGADSWLYFKPSSLSSTTNNIDLRVGENGVETELYDKRMKLLIKMYFSDKCVKYCVKRL